MPKFSVYTPTHDPRWLPECLASLRAQTDSDWEWVVLRNGKDRFEVPPELRADPRVRVYDSGSAGIGRLKGEAVKLCQGDVLVELDHDDRLASTCLAELRAAAEAAPGGFYYSDFASVYPNGANETFGSDWGWESYPAEIDGERHLCQRSFPPNAKTMSEIWFAPNHVRAWSRAAYDLTGGYDPELPVCDDHDLVCRTYLAGVPCVHVEKPLYLYRRVIDPKRTNSYVAAGDNVTKLNYRNMNRYLHPLVQEWCRREGLPMLDLGGAHNSPLGFIPVDVEFPHNDLDKLRRDLREPYARWPARLGGDVIEVLRQLPDDSVGCIRAFDFIEHLHRLDMVPFMNDVYRVLVPGGFLISGTPSTDGRGAFQDPTHTNFLNENSFWYYTNREFSKYLNGAVKCRFQAVRLWTEAPTEWHKAHNIPYVYADLLAVKGFKHTGPVHI